MTLFTERFEKLNKQQQDAVSSRGRCVVQAGPGSGKTHILVLKVAYIAQEVLKPLEGLACITYHNDAVQEIETRLADFGCNKSRKLFIGSVHGFCLAAIILPFKHICLPDWPSFLSIADGETQRECFDIAVRRLEQKDTSSSIYLQTLQQHRLDFPWYNNAISYDPIARTLREEYENQLRKRGLIDYNDIAIAAARLINDYPLVRQAVVSCYPWIVVDEYQNLGYPFHLVIQKLLDATAVKLFAVGDSDQSIYGFQSAHPQFLKDLYARGDVTKINLGLNYRCGQYIIESAETVLSSDERQHRVSSRGDMQPGKVIPLLCQNGLDDQIDKIINEIIPELTAKDYVPGDIAILCRHTETVERISKEFRNSKIPYSGSHDQRYTRTPLTRWLENVARWVEGGWQTGYPTFFRLYEIYNEFLWQNGLAIHPNQRFKHRTATFSSLWNLRSQEMLISDWLATIEETLSDFLPLLSRMVDTSPRDAEAYGELKSAANLHGKLAKSKVIDLSRCGRVAENILLSTLHSSQGLEFKAVILPDLEEGRLPSYQAIRDKKIDEERRLLYVGITRAKYEVYLLYSGGYTVQTQWGERSFNNGRSRFIGELIEKGLSDIDTIDL